MTDHPPRCRNCRVWLLDDDEMDESLCIECADRRFALLCEPPHDDEADREANNNGLGV